MAKKTLDDLLEELEPAVARAFLQSIARITSDAQVDLLIAAIKARDIQRAIAVLNLDSAYFEPLDRALRDAYAAGGALMMDEVRSMARGQGARVVARFDVFNPAAQRFMREQSSRLVVEITSEAREMVRDKLVAAFDAGGRSPRTVALDIVGRIDRTKGTRTGGVIGLTSGDETAAMRAYEELRSGDPARMENYLSRKTRDRRFDSVVRRAIASGKPVPAKQAAAMQAMMRNKMLRNRGERIARTELIGGLNQSNDDALEQLIEAGKTPRDAVRVTWDAANDKDTRESHAAMDGQTVTQGQPFTTGAGYQMKHPGDRSLGAPASEFINCRCVVRRDIDFSFMLADA